MNSSYLLQHMLIHCAPTQIGEIKQNSMGAYHRAPESILSSIKAESFSVFHSNTVQLI